MTVLYTNAVLVTLTPAEFRPYDTIQVSALDAVSAVRLRLGAAGQVSLALQLDGRSAEIIGSDGNDTLISGLGNDSLYGGAGDDHLSGGAGADALYGGGGNDILEFDASSQSTDLYFGGKGYDWLEIGVPGTGLHHLILGPDSSIEALIWRTGHFVGTGTAGDDVIDLSGVRYVNIGLDMLAGHDRITLSNQDNGLASGAGNDTIHSLGGNDRIYNSQGNDLIYGGDGNDILELEGGQSTVFGDAGNDQIILRDGSALSLIFGGDGFDNLTIPDFADLRFHNLVFTPQMSIEWFQPLGGLKGTSRGDLIDLGVRGLRAGGAAFLGGGNDTFLGSADTNSAYGGSGDDSLTTGKGDDYLFGGGGVDTLIGGLGDDIYGIDSSADLVVEFAAQGTDTVELSLANYTMIAEIEIAKVMLRTGAHVTGNSGDNTIFGGRGEDYLDGGGGVDLLYGGEGNDTLDGGTSTCALFGGNGRNTYLVSNDAQHVYGGLDYDTVISTASTFTLTDGTEKLISLYTGDSTLYGSFTSNLIIANAGNDELHGENGGDTLIGGLGDDVYYISGFNSIVREDADGGVDLVDSFGSAILPANVENLFGSDTLTGNSLDNIIVGKARDDQLFGLNGDDTLNGGVGIDRMTGGIGSDVFVFDDLRTGEVDVIADFAAEDEIWLYGSETGLFFTLPVGALAASAFKVVTFAMQYAADDRILYDETTGALYYDPDGFGGIYIAVQFMTLENAPNLNASAFQIVA